MLTELIMALYGWSDVWVTTIGDPDDAPGSGHPVVDAFKVRGFYVGTWTGPDGDMLCVRRTLNDVAAQRYRSPPGRTLFGAVVRGAVVRLSSDLAVHFQTYPERAWKRHHQSGSRAR